MGFGTHFFSQPWIDLPTDKWGEYCVLKGELLYLPVRKGAFSDGASWPAVLGRDQIEAIRQAHDYMLANLGQPLTIEGLARRFHISGTFLKEGFRQMYGQSTRKFLQMRRMDKASELLRTTNQTVLQIAVAVGYESASQFSQIFKRHYQLPPAQYRRQIIKRNV
ncbi:MAG: helix-turn-helix domain-containing protein [Evtepia gabavorous]